MGRYRKGEGERGGGGGGGLVSEASWKEKDDSWIFPVNLTLPSLDFSS